MPNEEHLYVAPKGWVTGNNDLEYVQSYQTDEKEGAVSKATRDAEYLHKKLPEDKKVFHEGGPKRENVRPFDWSQTREKQETWSEKPEPGKILDIT